MIRYLTKINTSIPGLDVVFHKIGSSLYATINHKASGKTALTFTRAPLPYGMREFIKRLDASELTTIDWTLTADELEARYAPHEMWPLAQRVTETVLRN